MNSLWAVARNETIQILRDRWYLLLMTVGAMTTLVTLAYTLSSDIQRVTTLVVDRDRGRHSRRFVQSLENDAFFAPELVLRQDEAERRLEQGEAGVVFLIPADYSRCIDSLQPAQVQALVDGSKPVVAELASRHISALAAGISQRLIAERGERQGGAALQPLTFHLRVRYNAEQKTLVSVVPGLMAIVLIVPAVGASAAYARERERGSFELVISTPLGRGALLLGRILPYVLVGLVDIGIFTVVAGVAFGVPLRGDLGLVVLLGLIYIMATASSGIFIAQFLRSQHAAVIATFMLFGIAPIYLSDIFFPVLSMPVWLQWLSALQPATHFTAITRGAFLKGVGWDVLWPSGLAMLGMSMIMGALAYLRLRKKLP